VTTKQTRIRLRIAILLGFLLVLAGAASVAAVSLSLPGVGRASHTGEAGGIAIGERRDISVPAGPLEPGATVRSGHDVVNLDHRTLRYALTSTSTNADGKGVRDVIHVTIRTADRGSSAGADCDRFDGSILYDGPLGADSAGFGDVEMGAHAGDRLLAPGQHETLCFETGMRLDAGNEYQAASTATTWSIVAEQEAGNP
jgi:hypothetical protein